MNQELYDKAFSLIGHHCTLDKSIPFVVGCGQAMSYVLRQIAPDLIPLKGISGTAEWATKMANSSRFEEVPIPEVGSIIVSITGTGKGIIRGHIGVVGKNHIMSNRSADGTWEADWTHQHWIMYYHIFGGLQTKYYNVKK